MTKSTRHTDDGGLSGADKIKVADMANSFSEKLDALSLAEYKLWESVLPDPALRGGVIAYALSSHLKAIDDVFNKNRK